MLQKFKRENEKKNKSRSKITKINNKKINETNKIKIKITKKRKNPDDQNKS